MASDQNDFSKGSVVRNIINLAVPMTLAQLINVLYNVVDRIYIGRIPGAGSLPLTGVGLCLPIISMVTAFANLFGMGGAPLCSIERGRGNVDEAEKIMGNSFAMMVIFGIGLTVLGIALKRPMLYLFGASDNTYPYADQYVTIYLLGSLFVMAGLGMNSFINSQGFGRIGMMTVLLGAVANIILDPIFIFVFHMGVQGAALATIISQALSAAWILKFLTGKKTILKLRRSAMKLEKKRVLSIMGLGLSGFTMSITNSLVQIVCNATLRDFGGDLYVGVMTVINSIREVVQMPLQGFTQGAQPVLGYNYGAKRYGRVREGIRFVTFVSLAFASFAWLILMLFPGQLIRLFNGEEELLEVGILSLRIHFVLFVFMAFQYAGQNIFVSLGKAKQAVFFSLFRKVILGVPLILLLPHLWNLGIYGVLAAEPVTNIIGGLACYLTMLYLVGRELKAGERAQKG